MAVSIAERRHSFSFEEYADVAERSPIRVEHWEGAILDMFQVDRLIGNTIWHTKFVSSASGCVATGSISHVVLAASTSRLPARQYCSGQ